MNWSRLACITLAITAATPLVTLVAQEGRAIPRLLESFAAQRLTTEATQLAIYADQLESLRLSFLAKENNVAVEQVAAEAKSVLSKLKTLQEQAANPPEAGPSSQDEALNTLFSQEGVTEITGAEKPRGKGTTILRPNSATSIPANEPRRKFWAIEKAAQQWTLEDLQPGKYKVRLEFRAKLGESGGTGQLEITGNSTPIPFRITPSEETGRKFHSQDIAILQIEKCPVDLTIRAVSHAVADSPLFDLVAVWLHEVPADGDKGKAPDPEPGPPRKDADRKKVDF